MSDKGIGNFGIWWLLVLDHDPFDYLSRANRRRRQQLERNCGESCLAHSKLAASFVDGSSIKAYHRRYPTRRPPEISSMQSIPIYIYQSSFFLFIIFLAMSFLTAVGEKSLEKFCGVSVIAAVVMRATGKMAKAGRLLWACVEGNNSIY